MSTAGGEPRNGGSAEESVSSIHGLLTASLIVPVRSSSGQELDAARVATEAMRHGSDEEGPFLAAYTDRGLFERFGPPRSDYVTLSGRDLLQRAERGAERLVLDPGSPQQRELPVAVVAAAVADLVTPEPEDRQVRRSLQPLPELSAPGDVPAPLADALRAALEKLPQVARAWLLRRGEGWTIGIQLAPDAVLSDFDEVRNRLHAVATEQLGTRRALAVTDLRAPSLREHYDSLSAPFYERRQRRGLLSRLFGAAR